MSVFFLFLEFLFIQGYLASHSLPYIPSIDKNSITVGGFSSGACFATQVPNYIFESIIRYLARFYK